MKCLLRINLFLFQLLLLSSLCDAQSVQQPKTINPCGNVDADIQLWGMTSAGGFDTGSLVGVGTIFRINEDGTRDTTPIVLNNVNGAHPDGSLILGGDDKLYGLTDAGGTNGHGVIFSVDPATANYTVVFNFDSTSGGSPYNSLYKANDGRLYGVTSGGGANSGSTGVIFSFDISSITYNRLFDFSDSDGSHCQGNLMQASDGKLYGMANNGGAQNTGVLFSFNPMNNEFTKLLDFTDSLGTHPGGALIEPRLGKLYGMTNEAGTFGYGVIFSYDLSNRAYQVVHYFTNPQLGWGPWGSLVQANNGKLYGVTNQGSALHDAGGYSHDNGVIFSFDPDSNIYTKLIDFPLSPNYGGPYGSLTQGLSGKLYGLNKGSGRYGLGTIFSFDIDSNAYQEMHSFNGADGGFPYGGLLELKCTPTGVKEVPENTLSISPNPSNNYISISSILNIGELIVSNIMGQVVKQEFVNATTARIYINTSGVYFVTVRSADFITTQKLIIEK